MAIQESGENYLETILILEKRNEVVRSVDIAKELHFSKPSVSRAVNVLKNDGYIEIEKGGSIHLTTEGRKIAEQIYERHLLLTEYLIYIGVNEQTAMEDACRMEHIISQETFDCLKKHLLLHKK
ncbi:MAG: metal-dependent transcriptional regulator [Erysipelotrichaceae bacterium]|nr:metal-dependent transcriptional regulator [Erysipelotrichaceae bacterium]